MITYKEDNWLHNTQIIRDRIYELEHLATGLMARLGTTEAIWLFHFKQIIETG